MSANSGLDSHSNTMTEHPLFNTFSSVAYAQETRMILLRALQRRVAQKTEQRHDLHCRKAKPPGHLGTKQ